MNQLLDLLLEWHNNLPETTPELSLENQAKYLSKKYTTRTEQISTVVFNEDEGESQEVQEEAVLVCFKDIVCKYRPHLHMGDYWLYVKIVNSAPTYKFFSIIDDLDETYIWHAEHPHLSGGKPCLGSFQGDLQTAFQEATNMVNFDAAFGDAALNLPEWITLLDVAGVTAGPIRPYAPPLKFADNGNTLMF